MGKNSSKPKKIDPEELMRHMEENGDVVFEYYESHQDDVEKYIIENFWEEDVERWLQGIRNRSPSESLQVRKIDFLKQANTQSNKTSKYVNSALVVRRAAVFDLAIHFGNRPYDPERDDLSVAFGFGKKPEESTRTKIVCKVGDKAVPKTEWGCWALGRNGNVLTVRVNVPAHAVVARYEVNLRIVSGTKEGRKQSVHKGKSVIVIFNPFSEDDDVYMADEAERNEYVMNDEGVVYRGSQSRISGKSWDFAQFDEGILDAVLMMLNNDSRHLDRPIKTWKKRNNPVYVSRVLSAMVNSNDDRGVLIGNWSGKYEGEGVKAPWFWSGSAEIIRKWRNDGMRGVQFGQCWVFSGVLTTALRAVGIPARSVTNFASAHDTDANVTVDIYIDKNTGDKLDESSDSVWNFHVWNEGYFKRPDLVEGYDGWQVLDATPQEVSGVEDPGQGGRRGLMQCGPAPVQAIKEGKINIGYDSTFIFGEVNADRVYWQVENDQIVGKSVEKKSVGKFISTKAVGSSSREDITHIYKFPEGSEEERAAFRKAYGRGTRTRDLVYDVAEGVQPDPKFEIEVVEKERVAGREQEEVALGDNIAKFVKVKNVSSVARKTIIKVVSSCKRYVGTSCRVLQRQNKNVTIEPGQTEKFSVSIDCKEYLAGVVESPIIGIRVTVTDVNDGSTRVKEEDIMLETPNYLSVTCPDNVRVDDEVKIGASFKNSFPFPVTHGVFEFSFYGCTPEEVKVSVDHPIQPGETYTVEDLKVSPVSGKYSIRGKVNLVSSEFNDMVQRAYIPIKM